MTNSAKMTETKKPRTAKITLKCILCLAIALLFLSFGINTSAAAPTEYLITESEGVYTLSRYSDGTPTRLTSSESLSELLHLCDGGRVTLDNIEAREPLELGGITITVAGTLTARGIITVTAGTSLTLDNVSLTTDAYIRVKGGRLSLNGGTLTSQGTVIITDYSSSALLSANLSRIITTGTAPAVLLSSGSAHIKGGEISSNGECAIENAASLSLEASPKILGTRYGILTSSPVSLSSGASAFSGELSVKWQGIFEKGSMHEIFRSASPDSLSGITLYDGLGRAYPITYFKDSQHTDETDFGAVYLPYELTYYDGAEKLLTQYYLHGEISAPPAHADKRGYSFVGWYADEQRTEDFSFGDSIESDMQVFADYKLTAPTFELSSLTFTYDGTQRLFGFERLTHELDSEGFYTLEWYKNGAYIGNYDKISIKSVADSGAYYCIITFRHSKNSISITTPEVNVTVQRCAVTLPAAQPKPYNGKFQYSGVNSTAHYTVSDSGGTDAGEYYITLTLTDSDNYMFAGNSEPTVDIPFLITKAENSWTTPPSIKDFYQSSVCPHGAYALYGSVYFLYSNRKTGAYTSTLPTEVGDYFCIAAVDETDNYKALASEPIAFSVLAEIPLGITLLTPPDKTLYKAFDKLSPVGLSISAAYNSGRTETVGAEKLLIKYQSGDRFLYGDNAVIVSYLGIELSVPVTVEKRAYDISGITFADKTATYNGTYQTIDFTGALPIGLDGIPLRASISTGGVDAGEYTLTMSFLSDSRNYILPDNITAKLNISPFSTDVIWENTLFVYDGTPKLPSAYYLNENGVKLPLSVNGTQVNAKESAIATAVSPGSNYILKNPTAEFTVMKADISFENVVWSASSFLYGNQSRSVTVSGLPEGVTVIGYTDNTATAAGSYTATALLSYNEQNYNAPAPLKHSWTIERLDYELSGFEFKNTVFVYDGALHYPELSGTLPIGIDGITLTYAFSHGITDVTDSDDVISIVFSTSSPNYNTPEPVYAKVKITPMPISVSWSYGGAVYDGLPHIPEAYSPYTKITVSGAMIDAGLYTAIASSSSANYSITNSEYSYEITKAQNSWREPPSIQNIFASGSPAPKAIPNAGSPVFTYYSDPECTQRVSAPLAAGVYYMLCTVPEGKNHLPLSHQPVRFDVMAVIPISLAVTMIKDSYVAFERITDGDVRAVVGYNDGASAVIPLSELAITYQAADAFRAGDTSLMVAYMSLTALKTVTVAKARYDTSGVLWQATEHTYSGEEKRPVLTGVPVGVEVIGYSGCGVNAGTYTVSAVLAYDEANYEPPAIPAVTLTVKKAVIPTPQIPSAEYCARPIYPLIDTELYSTSFGGATDAGAYTVILSLKDTQNYVLENGETSVSCRFTVLPRRISVSIPDQVLYLWEKPQMPEVELLGELLGSDVLPLAFEVSGNVMTVRSENPNYTLDGGVVTIDRLSRPSPDAVFIMIICAVMLLTLALITAALFMYRDKITDLVAMRRCKESFKREAEIRRIDDIVESVLDECASVFSVNVERADSLISDNLAKNLVKKERETVYTEGRRKCVINIDTVSDNFLMGEVVDVNTLKERGLIPQDASYVKVLARGAIDKSLTVKANAFSLSAVKMIALSGGQSVKVITQHRHIQEQEP